MPFDLARWLPEFPVRDRCLYLNHAAVAPLPRRAAEAMHERIADQEATGARNWERWLETEMAVRSRTAELLSCRADDVSIVHSTSEGLSLIAAGLDWSPGDVVLVGAEEFAANVAPYLALAARGVEVRRFPTPFGRVEPEAVLPLLKPPVRMLAISWVSFHTGWVAPIAELAQRARAEGILVVLDAIQGLGVLPADIGALGVDAVVADGHKWLLGPEGAGVLVTTAELRARLKPVLLGWRNVRRMAGSLFLERLEPLEDGRRFEPGSPASVLIAGLAAALDLLLEVGPEVIHARVVEHARTLTRALLEEGWTIASPGSQHPIAGIVAGTHPFMPPHEVMRRLRDRQIEVTARQGLVRFSPHFYATTGELEALRKIVAKL